MLCTFRDVFFSVFSIFPHSRFHMVGLRRMKSGYISSLPKSITTIITARESGENMR